MARQSIIQDIKNKAVEEAKKVDCVEILSAAGYPLRKRGHNVYSRCYCCGTTDGAMDKFSVNINENLYHCFGCGCGGGSSKLYSKLYNVSFIEAALILARKSGAITEDEFNYVIKTPDARKKLFSDEAVYKKISEKEANETAEYKAPLDTLDLVYRHLLRLPQFKLTQEHYTYLKNVRYLSDEEIAEHGYFTFSGPFSLNTLLDSILTEKPTFTPSNFWGVPGFFFVFSNKEKSRGTWYFKNPMPDCLGIPLRDSMGRIVALQMRYLGKKETKNKYFYVSSKSVKDFNGKSAGYGSSPGSPVAVCFPEEVTNTTFYVGEGIFKMREMAKEGSVAFSCQGVNTFSYVVDEAKLCMASDNLIARSAKIPQGQRIVKFCIVYDADMYEKSQVLEAALKTASFIRSVYPEKEISILTWDIELGKGFDDLKFNCLSYGIDYHRVVKKIDVDTFLNCVRESYSIADKEYLASGEHMHDGLKDDDILIRRTPGWSKILKRELWDNRLATIVV